MRTTVLILLVTAGAARALDPIPGLADAATLKARPRPAALEPVVRSAADALPRALAALRLEPKDITFDPHLEKPDPHRRALVNRVLTDPHALEREVTTIADRLLAHADDPVAVLAEACRLADLPPPPEPDDVPPLAEALAAFCDRPLAQLDLSSRVAVTRLTSLPPDFRAAVAGLLQAFVRARRAMDREASKYSPADVKFLVGEVFTSGEDRTDDHVGRLLALAAKADRQVPVHALSALAAAAAQLVAARNRLTAAQRALVVSSRVEGRRGCFFLGGPGSDRTDARDMLAVDVDGDDVHDLSGTRDPRHGFGEVRAIVDCGGDDRYFARDVPLAAGFCGVGLVADAGGDDIYDAEANALGSGILGAGMLVDAAGNDSYRVGAQGEGAALFGVGVLIDLDGSDTYQARGEAQGSASVGGVALLVDRAGNDSYTILGGGKDFRGDVFDSFGQGYGVGFRERASGGIGGLVDGGGNDTYSGDYWAQGVGYWYGLGFLYDRAGSDRYTAGRYAQGAGVHSAAGALIDRAGDDGYVAHSVAQGCGYDEAVGLLHDHAGNDAYLAHEFAQGCGFANGYGLLQDDRGSDTYMGWQSDVQGYASMRRGFGSVGVLLDLGGIDRYAPEGRNNTVLTRGDVGVLLDAPLNP